MCLSNTLLNSLWLYRFLVGLGILDYALHFKNRRKSGFWEKITEKDNSNNNFVNKIESSFSLWPIVERYDMLSRELNKNNKHLKIS